MAITDLLDRIPFSPRKEPAAAPPTRSFNVELPEIERVGIDLPPGVELPHDIDLPPGVDPPHDDASGSERPEPAALAEAPAARPPLPSNAIAAIGALLVMCLALSTALLVTGQDQAPAAQAAPPSQPDPPAQPEPASAPAATAPAALDATYAAEPSPIPVDLLTRLEAASEEPLDVELSRLLDAIQHGFGRRSTQLEPTLRSYVYRMSSRFEWNPDSFRVAVTAPDGDLAAARGATLERLFDDAVASGRLQVGTGVGPHALTLDTE